MIEVRFFFPCRFVEMNPFDGGVTLVGCDFSRILAAAFPATHPTMMMAARFLVDGEDIGTRHTWQLALRDEKGIEIHETIKGEFQIPALAEDDRYGLVNFMVGMNNIIFPEAGYYRVYLDIDGTSRTSTLFRVRLQEGDTLPLIPSMPALESRPQETSTDIHDVETLA